MTRPVRLLAWLALFPGTSHRHRKPFIAFDPATTRALSWISCYLLASHDYDLRCEPRHLFLACRRCGARSRGVMIDQPDGRSRSRPAPEAGMVHRFLRTP